MKIHSTFLLSVFASLASIPAHAAQFAAPPIIAQVPSQVKTGFQYGLGLLFMIGFIWGVINIWGGADRLKKGDADGKMGIVSGIIIAGAASIMAAMFYIFGMSDGALTPQFLFYPRLAMDTELRITDTNSANDSKGRALGFEGNDFLYVVVGIVGAIGIFLLLYGMFHASLAASGGIAVPVFVIPSAWVMMFRRGKPDGYAEDFFDHLLNREGFSFSPENQSPHGARTVRKRRFSNA